MEIQKIKKIITFIPHNKNTSWLENYPKPSKNFIPDWYKSIPRLDNNAKKVTWPMNSKIPNFTIKACIPFLDSLTNGYMVYLNEDIFVEWVDGYPSIRWHPNESLIDLHAEYQFPIKNIPLSETFHSMPFKFTYNWEIRVPEGYSIMFSHPHNRIDLPFYTLSGLVNCDEYNMPVNFPFLLKNGFEGIIKAGTPISQLTIIKNESWKSNIEEFNEELTFKKGRNFYKTAYGFYKKYVWKRDITFE